MQYTYDTYIKKLEIPAPVRVDTTTNFDEAHDLFEAYEKAGTFLFTMVSDNSNPSSFWHLNSNDDWADWRMKLERSFSWKPEQEVKVETKFVDDVVDRVFDLHTKHEEPHIECDNPHNPRSPSNQHSGPKTPPTIFGMTPIDPPHYQAYVDDYQWLETMCRIPRYRSNPNEFISALELQVRKYLDRAGRKDEDLQELQKGLWYYKFMVAYIKNGCNPIFVKQVDEILTRKFE